MIIDAHCHAGKGDGLTGPWDTDASLDRYLPRAERARIVQTVLLPVFHSDYRVANQRLARIVASAPRRFIGFAMVHPVRDAGRVDSLVAEAVLQHGFRGIKVHRYDARISREICDVARRFRLPILYDVMGETSPVELLAREYPDVVFVIPHLGSFSDDWRAHVAIIDQLERHPNVFTDTAGVRRFDYLVEALRRAGPHKVLFGSDGPWLHPGLELAKVKLLGLPPAEESLVLGGNLRRLLATPPGVVRRREPQSAQPFVAPVFERPLRDPWAPAVQPLS
jgi:predicted TIM-barrel fold metal-dependent hydrolase